MLVSVAVLIVFAGLGEAVELPFKVCSRSDPKFNQCLLESINDSVNILKDGVPELNIPPIEPLEIDRAVFKQGAENSRFNFRSAFKNVKISGLSSSRMTKTAAKFDNFTIKSEFYSDRADFVGDYEMSGQVLFIPVQGRGRANISMSQATSRHELIGEYYKNPIDGETYINVTDYKIKFKPKKVTFQFDNLYNGDKVLADTTNRVMNENWKIIYRELSPDYEKFFAEKIKSVANNVFQKIPMNKIFLD